MIPSWHNGKTRFYVESVFNILKNESYEDATKVDNGVGRINLKKDILKIKILK